MFFSSARLYKVAHWFEGADTRAKLLATYTLKLSGNVHAVTLLPGEFLYVASTDAVLQYLLTHCSYYDTCAQCAVDPYCSWNSASAFCYKREKTHKSAMGWISGDGPKDIDNCSGHVRHETFTLYAGDTVHLKCVALSPLWTFNEERLQSPSEKRQFTTEGGLVSGADSGVYECSVDGEVVVVYEITVDETECTQPTSLAQFKSKYREWCKKFENYKHSSKKWQHWYEKNK
ncbi:unnamed protein product [Gongylonema pulchrum]|uniref:Sema domain-containing protein n=1 Tax=Gongylonema pulchrum TaxID=637853 RepID=A0A183E3R3_9BILA|nr:unnamed protein product [Gongylonema pulchrum]